MARRSRVVTWAAVTACIAIVACSQIAGIEDIPVTDAAMTTIPFADAGSCVPHSVAGFVPPAVSFVPAACTPAQINDVVACQTGDAGVTPGCASSIFDSAGALDPCGQCIFTVASSGMWGAYVDLQPVPGPSNGSTSLFVADLAACVERQDRTSAGQKCGTSLATLDACELAACRPYCPVNGPQDMAGANALVAPGGCLTSAGPQVCPAYVALSTSDCQLAQRAFMSCQNLRDKAVAPAPTASDFASYLTAVCGQ